MKLRNKEQYPPGTFRNVGHEEFFLHQEGGTALKQGPHLQSFTEPVWVNQQQS